MKARTFFRVGVVLSLLLLAAMVLWVDPRMQALAGGATVPDTWIMGYDAAMLGAYLASAPDPQALIAFYAGPVWMLDTVFPVVLGLTLTLGIWIFGGRVRWLAVIGIAYAGVDLVENALLRAAFAGDMDGIGTASLLTQLKFLAVGAGLVLLAGAYLRNRRTV